MIRPFVFNIASLWASCRFTPRGYCYRILVVISRCQTLNETYFGLTKVIRYTIRENSSGFSYHLLYYALNFLHTSMSVMYITHNTHTHNFYVIYFCCIYMTYYFLIFNFILLFSINKIY